MLIGDMFAVTQHCHIMTKGLYNYFLINARKTKIQPLHQSFVKFNHSIFVLQTVYDLKPNQAYH